MLQATSSRALANVSCFLGVRGRAIWAVLLSSVRPDPEQTAELKKRYQKDCERRQRAGDLSR